MLLHECSERAEIANVFEHVGDDQIEHAVGQACVGAERIVGSDGETLVG